MSQKRVTKTKSVKKSGRKKSTQTISKKQTRSDLLEKIINLTKKFAKSDISGEWDYVTHTPIDNPIYSQISERNKETYYSPWIKIEISDRFEYLRARYSTTFGGDTLFEFHILNKEKPLKFKDVNKDKLLEIISRTKKRSIDNLWRH